MTYYGNNGYLFLFSYYYYFNNNCSIKILANMIHLRREFYFRMGVESNDMLLANLFSTFPIYKKDKLENWALAQI